MLDPATISLGMTLASQGMRMWADYTDRLAKGTVTDADLDEMATRLGVNIDGLRAEIAAKRAEPVVATLPVGKP